MPFSDDPSIINSQLKRTYENAIASLEDGARFAEYTIVRLLGRGGMGAVYEARHNTLERSYAIKVLPFEFVARKDAVERFENEARVMANLEHPNIVKVDDFRQTDGLYWLRMELARGAGNGIVSLQDLADQHEGVLDQSLLLELMTDVLQGIAYAHSKGVIHRDLKPANILLFPKSGGGLTAKVSDYGLVKMLGEEFLKSKVTTSVKLSMGGQTPGDKKGTSTRALLGTWEYMSPEQQEGRPVDARSDVYSLGLMIFRLLTGRKPSLSLPSSHIPELVKEWDTFLIHCLSTDKNERYQDAGRMLDKLKPVSAAVRDNGKTIDKVIPIIRDSIDTKDSKDSTCELSQDQDLWLRKPVFWITGFLAILIVIISVVFWMGDTHQKGGMTASRRSDPTSRMSSTEVDEPMAAVKSTAKPTEQPTPRPTFSPEPTLKPVVKPTARQKVKPTRKPTMVPTPLPTTTSLPNTTMVPLTERKQDSERDPKRVGGSVKGPKRIHYVSPKYPEIARKTRVQGLVIMEAVIDKIGNVVDLKVLKSLNSLCDQAAMDAARQWKFEPATEDGEPVNVVMTLTVQFTLN